MEDIRNVLEMIVSKTEEVDEAEDHEINKAHEESWTTVKPRKDKAQKERTGLISDRSSEMYQRTGLLIENGTEVDGNGMEIEDADSMDIEDDVRSMMPKIIVEDGIQCMIPEKKLSSRERWRRKRLEHHVKDGTKKVAEEKHDAPKSSDQRRLTTQERRCEKEEREKAAAMKAQVKAIMEETT